MPEWLSYGKFRTVTLNQHFSEKEERGDQGKFFKNRQKSSPCLKGPKALWCKMNYRGDQRGEIKGGTKGNFSKIAQKDAFVLKAQKHTSGNDIILLFSMQLSCKDWRRLRHKQRLKKGPNGEVRAIFGRSPKTCIF